MPDTIDACKRLEHRLVLFDSVHAYDVVHGAIIEDAPYNFAPGK